MKSIILSGGSGSRLYPITKGVSKQLLPIYNKPMIYYSLSVSMLAGIRDILLITTPEDQASFQRLFGDGSHLGINLQYAVQPKPEGLAQAFLIGEEFLDGDSACLTLGDNIFHGAGFSELLHKAMLCAGNLYETRFSGMVPDKELSFASIFGYHVNDPERYGVAEFDKNGTVISIEEKPKVPKSNCAVVGLYFYPNDVVGKAKQIKPSARGELEITTLNQMYLEENRLKINMFPRGFCWFDTGTFDGLSQASSYVETIEKRQGLKLACLEEIAYNNNWITTEQFLEQAKSMEKNEYGQYLLSLIKKN